MGQSGLLARLCPRSGVSSFSTEGLNDTPSNVCVFANRELQRGVPPPYGEAFSKETLIRSASSKAFAATTEARNGER